MSERIRNLAATAIAVIAVVITWAGLTREVSPFHLGLIALLAAAPALVTPARGRGRHLRPAIAAAVALPLIAALATRQSLIDLIGVDSTAWSRVGRVIPDGLSAAESAIVPAAPNDHPAFVALLDFGLAALVAAVCWQLLVRRRAAAAVVLAGLGLSYRWTVEPPGAPLLVGVLALAALLAVLALTAWHRAEPRPGAASRAIAVGISSLAVALVFASGPAAPGPAWWDWRAWGVGSSTASAGGLDVAQTYGQLRWPDSPRVVMRVSSPLGLSLRAATLTSFDGNAFVVDTRVSSQQLPVSDGTVSVTEPPADRDTIQQRVRVEGLRSPLLMAGGPPVSFVGEFTGTADLRADTIQVTPGVEPGDEYLATISPSDPDPATLLAAREYAPGEAPLGMTRLAASFAAAPFDVPLWGSDDATPSAAEFGEYARVRALALRVVGDAASPYAAASRIEAYLRGGTYVYDEAPPRPQPGEPPLVDFLFDTKQGFCQHFAGSMAVMLRSIGIPTRLAVGYTKGRLDATSREWEILDRDAHTWVEAYLPGEGWVNLDPTPGRAAANRVSVSSPRFSPPPTTGPQRPEIAQEPVAPVADGPQPREAAPADSGGDVSAQTGGRSGWGAGQVLVALLAGLAAVGLLVPSGLRVARRAWNRRHGDERQRVLAAVGDLERHATALGFGPTPSASPTERAALLRRRLALDADRLYAMAARARYAPAPLAAGSGAVAWRESSRLRREMGSRAPRGRRLRARLGLPTVRRPASVST